MVRSIRRNVLNQREEGFTLVELVVAMLVIAIVLIAIITVQARALTTNADSQARQVSTAVANQAMEQFRSMPWNSLRKGLASNFVAAAGGDPFVVGSNLVLDDGTTYALKVAPSSNDQDLTKPRPPLFTSTGSNATLQTSPSGNGDQYTVRAYTTVDESGNASTVGLVVVSSWTSRVTGETLYTVLTSAAYSASGCGSANAPYLAACQASFDGQASGGQVVVGATATDLAGNPAPLLPGSPFYTFSMATATASAGVSSLQVSTATSLVSYGGTVYDDNNAATSPSDFNWIRGYDKYSLKASDDNTTGAPAANPADVNGSGTLSTATLPAGSIFLSWRSDDTRTSVLDASTTQACSTGSFPTPTGEPCAHARIARNLQDTGYAYLSLGAKDFRLAEVTKVSGDSVDHAWAVRFTSLAGNSTVGCLAVSGSGCVSAGANRTIGKTVIGQSTNGTWDSNFAPDGLVVISGYSESILAQRGIGLAATPSSTTRSGSVKYWNGASYTAFTLASGTSRAKTALAPVTFTDSDFSMVAEATIAISPVSTSAAGTGDPTCKAAACTVSASNGSINVTVRYTITPTDATVAPFVLEIVTLINGSQAGASFKEAPDA